MASLDRDEFGRLFARHARMLWVIAAAFVPRATVDDVLQDAAAVGLARLARFRAGSDFAAWMAQIVRHVAANHARRGRALAPHLEDEPVAARCALPAVTDDGHVADGQDAFDDAVVRALTLLAPEARACLLLDAVLGLEHATIAATLDLPVNTVASHVHRARQALRQRLGSGRGPLATNTMRPADKETSRP
ncbi:MAG: RNA polymerase sigma factor [Planctomycetota bacterium]